MEEDTEYLKLPIDDRCQHKLWKARVNGYEAATKLFNELTDEKSPEWNKYLGLVKKFVVDGNAVAQEKGLDAVLAYVTNAGCAGKTCGEVMSGLVSKCFGAPKARTRDKAMEIALMYVEIERHELVMEELAKGLTAKTPKVVVACVQVSRDALHAFGPKVVAIKPLVRQLPALLEDRDKAVRDEAKLLAVEIYRWIGAAFKPQLAALKPVQLGELDAEFEKVAGEKASPTRYLRSQQVVQAKKAAEAAECQDDGEDEDEADAAPEIDPLDFVQAVDILSKLPADFYEKCESKKWQDRKEAMDLLVPLAASPKLEVGDYWELIKTLKKIIAKDSNVVVVGLAGKCLAGLATGLRKRFQQFASQCLPVVLEKFKEKKPQVVAGMREAADAIYACTTIESVLEDVLAALDNKNPAVKLETTAFLARAFCRCDATLLAKKVLLKAYCGALLKTLNDTDAGVRDNSAQAIGTAMKVVGEKAIQPFVAEVDNIRMTKIKEFCANAEVIAPKKGIKGAKKAAVAPPAAASAAARPAGVKKASDGKEPVKPSSAPGARKPPVGVAKAAGLPKSAPKGKKGAAASGQVAEVVERELSDEEVEEKAGELLSSELVKGLADANWKQRLSSVEQLLEAVRGATPSELPTQALVRTLARKPGLRESNFQVLKVKLEALQLLASTNGGTSSSSFGRRSAHFVVDDLADKIGDAKNGPAAADTLTAIAEATRLDYLATQVLDYVFAQKSPRNQQEALNWLAGAIKEFGLQVQVKPVIDNVKKALAATNPAVRTSAITLLGVMFMYMGATLRVLFENEKTALLQQIDAEFEKMQGVSPPAAIRGAAAKTASGSGNGNDSEEEGGGGEQTQLNLADLIPRTDVSGQLSGALIEELSDKNWKLRLEALQKLGAIINDAKFIVPNLGDLPTVLKARMNDSNKNLANQAINICQAFGTGMGAGGTKYIRVLGPAMIAGLGDSKNTVRASAVACLSAWVEQCGLVPFFEGEMISDALKAENPNLRAELYGWLAEQLPNFKSVPAADLSLCLPHLYVALEDRTADVRKKAQDAVLPFMIHLGYEQMVRAAGKLKPANKTQVMLVVEKAKPLLPAKPPPAPATSKAVRGGGGKPAASGAADAGEEGRSEARSASARTGQKAPRASSKSRLPNSAKPAIAGKKKKEEDADMSPPILDNNLKEQRQMDELKLKVLKWNFTSPRDEFYELLREQMTTAGFNRNLLTQLFHNDFKFHLKAIDTLQECIETAPDATVANLDLSLKWLALRFFDTNPSVLLRGLEYLKGLFAMLASQTYHLLEYEAASFLPYLVLKVGDPKDAVRLAVRGLFQQTCRIYPANRLFVHLMDGLKSKNARQRTECLEELGLLIDGYGMSVCQPNPAAALKEVAKQIADRDNSVRQAALNCLVMAFNIDGEKIYKFVGPISDKDMGLLEERIKRSAKTRSPPAPNHPSAAVPNAVPHPAASHTPAQPGNATFVASAATVVAPSDGRLRVLAARTILGSSVDGEQHSNVVRRLTSARGQMSRPVSGAFSLDLDNVEQTAQEDSNLEFPQLYNQNLDDILKEPIKFPETKMRPPSPAAKILQQSVDAASALELVISQVASNEPSTSLQALAQLDEFLKSPERAEALVSRVDQLLIAVALQYRMTYARHMGNDAAQRCDVVRLYRTLTMTLVSLSHHSCLARSISRDVLRDLVSILVTILLDTRLTEVNEGGIVVRSINVLVVKLVERTDHTCMMSALVRLLHDCVHNDNSSAKFTELIMKCLWRMVRILTSIIDEINFDRILLDLHQFLKAFPSSYWKSRSDDMPLRTVKTILHALAKLIGNKIMSHLTLIDNVQDSEIEAYLQKVLKGGVRAHRVPTNNADQNLATDEHRRDRHSPRRLSKTTQEMLAETFKKIGCKQTTREGLADLYAFKKCHPEADIEPFLSKSSRFFQNYIERGLHNIEAERTGGGMGVQHPLYRQSQLSNSTGSIPNATAAESEDHAGGGGGKPAPSAYMERLVRLRAKCGMDNSQYESGIQVGVAKFSSSRTSISKSVSSSLETQTNSEETFETTTTTTTTLVHHEAPVRSAGGMPHSNSSEGLTTLASNGGTFDDLRRRLDRIKNSGKSS